MDQTSFVGCLLFVDCGESVGTFQGEVTDVNKDQQTISLKRPYRNGIKYDALEVTLRAVDIRDLKILKSFKEHKSEACEKKDSSLKTLHSAPALNGTDTVHHHNTSNKHRGSENDRNRTPRKQDRQSSAGHGRTPTKQRSGDGSNQNQKNASGGNQTTIYSGLQHSAFQRVQKEEDKGKRSEDEGEAVESEKGRKSRYMYYSGNLDTNQKVRSSPRKIDGGQKQRRNLGANARNEECFSAPVESFLATDFDFDKSMRSFNKAAVFEEIASTMATGDNKKKVKNIPHDEDILLDNVPAFIHDKGGRQVKCTSYTSETGVVIPAASVDLVQSLYQAADKLGLTTERRLEAGGVSISKMALDLINGKSRVGNQLAILVLCGPHLQGAQGINCARHLANHDADVMLFMPNFAKMPEVVTAELRLFKETSGKHVTNIKDLPEDPPDLIISALDTPTDASFAKQPWLKSIVTWVTANKASVLSVDPSPTHSVRSKWSVITALPLSYDNTNVGLLYLCDAGIPTKVFTAVGVKYRSPFKDKFVVRLHNR